MNVYRECYVCRTTQDLHSHHVFGAANKKTSDKYKFKEDLCGKHHNLSDDGVHFNKKLSDELKRKHQAIFEETHTREEFVRLIGRNYIGLK